VIGEWAREGTRAFDPPGEPARGNDWVLVLDDAAKRFPPPGELR
jgi:collagenase-like protein with putative collagen-binding domain